MVGLSPLSPLQSLFGHHDWTDKHVVVTAETVNTNTDKTQPRVIGGLQGALTKTHKKTEVPNLIHLVSKIVSEWISNQSGH